MKLLLLVLSILIPCAACASPKQVRIVCFGDSITYGIGAPKGMDYCSQIRRLLPADISVNLGRPGENTFDGVIRAKKVFAAEKGKATYVFLLEGVNDWSLGHSPAETVYNLAVIRNYALNTGATVFVGKLTPVYNAEPITSWVEDVNALLWFANADFSQLPFDQFSTEYPGHLNSAGYYTMAAIAVNAILDRVSGKYEKRK